MNIFKMAWRNVWRHRRRSLITIAAMAFALFTELIYSGLIPGYMSSLESDIVDLQLGDIQIHAKGYQDNPSLYTRIQAPDALIAKIEGARLLASERLVGGALAASGNQSAGVSLQGVDIARESRVSRLAERVEKGSWLDPSDPKGVVVGRQLARSLGAGPGAELVLLTQAADGSMANDLFHVRGVLHGIAESTDRASVFMPGATFRELMVVPEGAHEIVVRRGDMDLDSALALVKGLAPADQELEIKSWRQTLPILAQMVDSTQGLVYIFFFVLYIAVGILILNAMLMAVFERIRELGVLKAIGAGPLRILGLILVESFIQTFVAMIVGTLTALPFMVWLTVKGVDVGILGGVDMMGVAMRPVWYGIYGPESLVAPLLMLWIIVGAAALYPALKAAWIDPIRAIHHQ